MVIVKLNQEEKNYHVAFEGEGVVLNGSPVAWSCVPTPQGSYSIICNRHTYLAHLIRLDRENKTLTLRIHGQDYVVVLQEPIDQLLKSMGIQSGTGKKVNEIKAPMPGLVLKILVSDGQVIHKGDPVLVLEAMKMENVFKAPADAMVKAVKVKERTAVEKGEVLVVLE